MNIERHENGNIEVEISFTLMSYLALFGAICCFGGILYFWVIEGLNIFSIQIIGLVLAGVVLGISGIIIYESSHFVFDNEKVNCAGIKESTLEPKKAPFLSMISKK